MNASAASARRRAVILTRKLASALATLTENLRAPITLEQVNHTRKTLTYAKVHNGPGRGRYTISTGGRARRMGSS